MRARLFVVLLAWVVLIAFAWMLPIAPVSTTAFAQQRANTPTFAGPPAGMQALPMDLFLSTNFYKDQKLWSDQRYFRCNTPRQLTDMWTARQGGVLPSEPGLRARIGDKPPASAAWG